MVKWLTELKNEKVNKNSIISNVQVIRSIIAENNKEKLFDKLQDMHLADVADIIEDLNRRERKKIITLASSFINSEILFYLKEKYKKQIIQWLGTQHFKESIEQLSNEDIFSIIRTLDKETQKKFLFFLPAKREKIIKLFLTYPQTSIGHCMSVDFIAVPQKFSIHQTLETISKKNDLPENFSECFVVDYKNKPVGIVALKDIIDAPLNDNISKYMDPDIIPVEVFKNKDSVINVLNKYKIICAPVVSNKGEVIGILRSDDLLEIVSEEVSEGILDVGGISFDDTQISFLSGCFMRLRWIFLTTINASFSPLVLNCFKDVMQHTISLAVLMPLVTSIGGVVGIQTVSVTIRDFAQGHLRPQTFLKTILREASMGLINGLILGIVLGIIISFSFHDIRLGFVLSLAMLFCMTWAAFIGAALPIAASKLGFDSAISSGPVVTTIADVSGFAIFLSLAKLILL
jgi:magnesium transporter